MEDEFINNGGCTMNEWRIESGEQLLINRGCMKDALRVKRVEDE